MLLLPLLEMICYIFVTGEVRDIKVGIVNEERCANNVFFREEEASGCYLKGLSCRFLKTLEGDDMIQKVMCS